LSEQALGEGDVVAKGGAGPPQAALTPLGGESG
jgi:hypothetical protein